MISIVSGFSRLIGVVQLQCTVLCECSLLLIVISRALTFAISIERLAIDQLLVGDSEQAREPPHMR